MASSDPSLLLISAVSKGHEFTRFVRADGKDTSSASFVFFEKDDGDDGTIYWCEVGKREKVDGQSLALEEVTDVFMGKETNIFQSEIAASIDEDCCFSLVSDDFELNLLADDDEVVETWVDAINAVLNPEEDDEENDLGDDDAVEAKSNKASLGLQQGIDVTRYTAEPEGKDSAFVFFKPNDEFVGTFYWNKDNDGEELNDQSIPLNDVTDIMVGKQTAAFKTATAESADKSCCFSIVGKESTFDLEVANADVLNAWIQGISALLKAAGGSVAVNDASDDVDEDGVESKGAADDETSFAVDANPAASVDQAAAAAAVEEEDAKDDATKEAEAANEEWAATTPSLSDKGALLEMMAEGREFKRITASGTAMILLFWESMGDKTGSLYWSEPGRRVVSADQCIPVKTLSDILVGRMAPEFKTPHGKHCGSGKCFSFISKKKSLHLEAQTKEQVQAWLIGIKTIVSKSGAQVVEGEKKSKSKKNRRLSIMAGAKAEPETDAASFLRAGAKFNIVARDKGEVKLTQSVIKLDDSDKAVPKFVYNDGEEVELRKLTDIFVGKQTPELKDPACSDFESGCCMSLIGKNTSLHVIAESKSVIDKYLAGIQFVIVSQGKAVVTDLSNKKKKGNRRFSVMSKSDTTRNAPITSKMTPAAITKMMRNGRNVYSYNKNKSGFVKKQRSFVCFSDGAFYWSDASRPVKNDDKSIALRKLTDVFVGKTTDELKSNVAGPADPKHCLSLVSKTNSFHAEFQSKQEVMAWIGGIQNLIAASGKKVVEGDGKTASSKTGAATVAETKKEASKTGPRRYSVLDGKKATAKGDPRTIMKGGEVFTAFFKDPANPKEIKSNRITLFVDLNTKIFYWCAPGRKLRNEKNCLPLSTITDIWVGKQTPELQQEGLADVPARNCFSLVGTNNSLHLYAQDKVSVNRWIKGIQAIIAGAGKDMKVEKPADKDAAAAQKKSGTRRFSVMARSALDEQTTLRKVPGAEECVKFIEGGRKVKSYVNANGVITGTVVTFFYNKAKSTFFWNAKGKVEDAKQAIALSDISDIYLGKQTVELKSKAAANVKKDAALSIISRTGTCLYLELSNGTEVKAFLEAIKYCVQNTGKALQDEEKGSKKKRGGNRRFSVMAKPTLGKQENVSKKLTGPEAVTMIRSGRNFNSFVRNPTTGQVEKKAIFLFFSQSKGAFFWSDQETKASEPENTLKLSKVSDIFMGKQTFELKSAVAEDVSRNLCWSMTAKNGARLNLEAQTPAEVKNWIKGIQEIIKSQTGNALTEEKQSKRGNKKKAPRKFSVMASASTHDAKITTVPAADECVELMRKGFKATTLGLDGGRYKATQSTVFYSRDDNAIHWCDQKGDRRKVPGQSIGIRDITDIFMGKQTEAFKSDAARLVNADGAITIVGRNKVSLSMEVQSGVIVQLWLDGIVFIVKNVEGKTVVEDGPKKPTAKSAAPKKIGGNRRFSVMAKKAGSQNAITSVLSGAEAVRSLMRKGREVERYELEDGRLKKTKQLLFYVQAARTLYWCAPGQRDQDDANSLPLNTVTDIYMGKAGPEFKSPGAAKVASVTCLSVVGKNNELHVVLETAAEVKSWIEGLKHELVTNGKNIVEDEKVNAKNNRRFSVMAGARTSQVAISATLKGDGALKLMREGRIFFSYEKSSLGDFDKHRLFLYYSTAQKTFFWCQPGERTQSYDHALPLQQITDIYLGKQTKHLQSGTAASADAKSCFSILSKTHGLHLEAGSGEEVMSWLEGIKAAVAASGKKVVGGESKKGGKRRYSVLTGSAAAVDTKKTIKAKMSTAQCIEMMIGGRDVDLFYKDAETGEIATRTACLFYQDSVFYWSPAGINQRVKATKQLNLSSLTDIYLGKRGRAVFETPLAADVESNRCFSLVGKSSEVHVAVQSKEELEAWLTGLKHLVSSGGKKLVEDDAKAATAKGGKRRFSVMSSAASKDAKPEDAVRAVKQGADFYLYREANGAVQKKRIFLFYDSTEVRGGAIYWCNRGQRTMSEKRQLHIKKLTDIYVGKHHKVMKSAEAKSAVAENVISLVTRNQDVHLEGSSKNSVTTWLKALQFLIAATGRGAVVEEAKGQSGGLSKTRKFSIMNKMPKSTRKDINLSDSKASDVELQMRHGLAFKYVSAVDIQDCIVYFRSGAFYCCVEDDMSKAAVVIGLKSLTDIFLGKQTSIMKNHAMTADFSKDVCVGLKNKTDEMNLIAESKDQVTNFVGGIKHLLSKNTSKKMFLEDNNTPATKGSRRYSIMSKVGVSVAKQAKAVEKEFDIAVLTDGLNVTSYGNVQAPKKTAVRVFYVATAGPKGSLFWCPQEADNQQIQGQQLQLAEITDIYMGTQAEIFTKSVAAGANPAACLAIVGKSNILNIEAASGDDMKLVLHAITSILSAKAGKKIVMAEVASSKKGQRRFSVMTGNEGKSSHGMESKTPMHVLKQFAADPSSLLGNDVSEAIESMEHGKRFFLYHETSPTIWERKEVTLFYSAADGPLGTLYYCSPGKRIKDPFASVGIADITDVFYGKRTEGLKSVAASRADKKLCVAFGTTKHELNLESPSAGQLSTFLFGITHKMLSKNKAANSATGAIAKTAKTYPAEVNAMIKGAKFTLYSEGENDNVESVVVAFVPADELGSLTITSASGTQSVDLYDVSTVLEGKESPVLQLPFAADATESSCFSIVLDNGSSIDLEAISQRTRDKWLSGMSKIFEGGDVDVEEEATSVSEKKSNRRMSVAQKSKGASKKAKAKRVITSKKPSALQEENILESKSVAGAAADKDAINAIQAGAVFTGFAQNREGRFVKKQLNMFYEPDGKVGTLYWCAASARVKSQACSLALRQVTEILVGKHSSVLRASVADESPDELCFTLVTPHVSIDLEAPSTQTLNSWLYGIQGVLSEGGYRVLSDTTARRFTVSEGQRTVAKGDHAGFWVGFVGLNGVGHHIARHTAVARTSATNPVTKVQVWSKAADVAQQHEIKYGSSSVSRAAMTQCDVIFTCLDSSDEVEDVVTSLAPQLAPQTVIVDVSPAGDPARTKRLGASLALRGVTLIDAPLSGEREAKLGQLNALVGGPFLGFQLVYPILARFCGNVTHVGQLGAAQAVKAVESALQVAHLVAASEGLATLTKFGVDSKVALNAINSGAGRSYVTKRVLPEFVLSRGFDSGVSLGSLNTGVSVAADMLNKHNPEAVVLTQARAVVSRATRQYGEDGDYTQISRLIEENSKTELR